MAPNNGTVLLSTTSQLLGVGTTATYSCDPGYVLVGETIRTCKDPNSETMGKWSAEDPICKLYTNQYILHSVVLIFTGVIPNSALIECQVTPCRYEQLVCPEQDNCTVHCYDLRPYACFQTGVVCPSGRGDCTVNCDDSYACLQANTTCPQGDCTVNCENDYTCLSSAMECSGDNCLFTCGGQGSCSHSAMECSGSSCFFDCERRDSCSNSIMKCSGNCITNCNYESSCQYLFLQCYGGNCTLNCRDLYSCRYSTVLCSSDKDGLCYVYCNGDDACRDSDFTCPVGGNCVFHFEGVHSSSNRIGYNTNVMCKENSTCHVICAGRSSSNIDQCDNSHITCPRESGRCTVECSGYYACWEANIACGRDRDCLSCSGESSCYGATISLSTTDMIMLNCSGQHSCRYSRITCPANNNCAINCYSQYSCYEAKMTCPANSTCTINCQGQYSCSGTAEVTCPTESDCTINCDGQYSCQNARLTCPANNNCTINCDGQYSCNNARVTCPTGDYSCNILCTDPLSCSNLSITNTHNVYLQCCGGLSCAGTSVTPASTECPYIR